MNLFEGVNAWCRHKIALAPGEETCGLCEMENDLLCLTPPFTVECIDIQGTDLEHNTHYVAACVIQQGSSLWGEPAPGLLLRGEDNTVVPILYSTKRFIRA